MPKLSKSVQYACRSKNVLRLNTKWERSNAQVHVLQNRQNVVLLIKPFVWSRPRWRHHRGFLKLPIVSQETKQRTNVCVQSTVNNQNILKGFWRRKVQLRSKRLKRHALQSKYMYILNENPHVPSPLPCNMHSPRQTIIVWQKRIWYFRNNL